MVTLIDLIDMVDHRLKAYAAPVGPLPVSCSGAAVGNEIWCEGAADWLPDLLAAAA
jgi:hypothetical protein